MADAEDIAIPFVITVCVLCTILCICAVRRCQTKTKKPQQQQQQPTSTVNTIRKRKTKQLVQNSFEVLPSSNRNNSTDGTTELHEFIWRDSVVNKSLISINSLPFSFS